MNSQFFYIVKLFSIILVALLTVVTQSNAEMTLPYNGTIELSTPAFRINNIGNGTAIFGKTVNGPAVSGVKENQSGERDSIGFLGYFDDAGVWGDCPNGTGVIGGTSSGISGVSGEHRNSGTKGYLGKSNYGVMGESLDKTGVYGESKNSKGVYGHSRNDIGVSGFSQDGKAAIWAENGSGVRCLLATKSETGGSAVWAHNPSGAGVEATTDDKGSYAVYGSNLGNNNTGYLGKDTAGVYGQSSDGYAGEFIGKVKVTRTLTTKVLEITGGSDLSEQFNISSRSNHLQTIAGMVVSIDPDNPGELMISNQAYDRKVAGIISGAGGVNPGMVMAQENSAADGTNPVALSGRVYCLADASNGAITPGDLLTTSNNAGHAMKVKDYEKAQGAILGKAMTGLQKDRSLVLVLVNLQ